jgi:hypothetical protein
MASQTAQITQVQQAWLDAYPSYAMIESLQLDIHCRQCGAL